ncbi:endoplasmic reticulum-based factor for assembly of V-ATPase-domain-containing protein [Chytriomyces cf. hyalinus JEL632]|nr:endoplasmic reticulum-based factor for assembly of V-ATPase-domain-containing protein [Chytriomyces cf. hyalinus JEL632]
MVLVLVTPTLHSAITEALEKADKGQLGSSDIEHAFMEDCDRFRDTSIDQHIDHSAVKLLGKVLSRPLTQLLSGSKMIFDGCKGPVAEKDRQKSPQLLQILDDARRKTENDAYERMTQDVKPASSISILTRQERNEMKAVVGLFSSIVNVVFSMVAVFVSVYSIAYTVTSDVGMKTLLALFFTLVVGIAEGYFFTRDWLLSDPK